MENTTLGKKIAELRRGKGMKQDELAEALGVSPQAVSKWENDVSCPDITLLPEIGKLFDVSIDELLTGKKPDEVKLLPVDKRKKLDDLMLRVHVQSGNGDKVKINLPMPLVKLGLEIGFSIPQVNGNNVLKNIDLPKLLNDVVELAEKGLIGRLVEVDSADGDHVEIVVE